MAILPWVGFIVVILTLLAIDLGVVNRKEHVIGTREALAWTGFFVGLALSFNVLIYFLYEYHWLGIGLTYGQALTGKQAALQFFTGYLIEESLSLDNIFVIALILAHFKIPSIYQHRVLFWGILGALIFRGIMISAGSVLIARFYWVNYAFGLLLFFTAVKMLIARHDDPNFDENLIVRVVKKFFPVSRDLHGNHFFIKINDRWTITPLFLTLLIVEVTDIVFAVDSIPAIFAVTSEPFLVFTSNVFAILGLRSLYFALAGLMGMFRYLKASLIFILAFVGVKISLAHHFKIHTALSLAIILGILAAGILASFVSSRRDLKDRAS